MKIHKLFFLWGLCAILANTAQSMRPIPDTLIVPQYIQNISDADSLRQLLVTPGFKDIVPVYVRLGEIGNESDLRQLIETFKQQTYDISTDPGHGVKYYSLIAIGKIGGLNAEAFLRKVVNDLAPNLKQRDFSVTRYDSAMTLGAAVIGLGATGTASAGIFLDSVFVNKENLSTIRSMANYESLYIKMKNHLDLKTASDTALFLIEKWKNTQWASTEFTTKGLSEDYIVRKNIESLFYQYRSTLQPFVIELQRTLNPDDPKAAALEKLRLKMVENGN
jgi:hypothetical protein